MGKGGSDDPTSGKQFTGDINTTSADIVVDDIATWTYYEYINKDYNVKNNIDYIAYVRKSDGEAIRSFNKVSTDGTSSVVSDPTTRYIGQEATGYSNQDVYNILRNQRSNTSILYLGSKGINNVNFLYQLKDQIIKDTRTNIYYKISIQTKAIVTKTENITSNDGSVLTDLMAAFENYDGIFLNKP